MGYNVDTDIELSARENNNIVVSPRHLGDRREIASAHKRLLLMLPGAANMPMDVLWSLAQLAVAYRLDPFNGEIYVMTVGRKGWMKFGRTSTLSRLASRLGESWPTGNATHDCTGPKMDAEEVKKLRDLYEPEDIGAEVHLYRLDVATMQRRGRPLFSHRGAWRRNAKAIKDKQGNITSYLPDNIPQT
jgi:hypothetical protein